MSKKTHLNAEEEARQARMLENSLRDLREQEKVMGSTGKEYADPRIKRYQEQLAELKPAGTERS